MSNVRWSAERWIKELGNGLTTLRELDPNTHARLVYGASASGNPSFGLIVHKIPMIPKISSAVSISRVRREHDGTWLLLMTLEDQNFSEVFIQLCSHIYIKVQSAQSEQDGLKEALQCINEWRQLFRENNYGQLNSDQCRGLFAELYIGFDELAPELGESVVAEAWQGPLGADQDFQFPFGKLEVKSCHPETRSLQISSEYQLSGDNIVLAVVTLAESISPLPGYETLTSMVDRVRALLSYDAEASDAFGDGLAELGFDSGDQYYDERFYFCSAIDHFAVGEEFPRVTEHDLMLGVEGVRYRIEISQLAGFEIENDRVFEQLQGNGASSNG